MRTHESTQNLLQASNTVRHNPREDTIEGSRAFQAIMDLERQNELLIWEIEELHSMLGGPSPPYYASPRALDGQTSS